MGMNNRLMRPRASGFNPKSISGLQLWLDVADSTTLGNTSTGPGGATNNGPVKYVADKSGNGRHATNGGADSVCPTLFTNALNGYSVLGFDGGDFAGGVFSLTVTQQTVFVVCRMSAAAAAFGRLYTQSDAGNDYNTSGAYIPLLRYPGGTQLCSFAAGAARAPVYITADAWVIANSLHTGSEIQNRVNNGTASTYANTLNKAFTQYRVGATAPTVDSAAWQDRVAEVLVYDRALSAKERTAVAKYLGGKWNITVS